MAGKRQNWDSLSESYRNRLSRGGITKSQYQSGASLRKARGHAETPEHGLREAQRNRLRYRKYLDKNEKFGPSVTLNDEDEAYELNTARDNAYYNKKGRLGNYIKYNEQRTIARIYGDSDHPGMTLAEARWTANADTEELRSRASEYARGNDDVVWFYH